LKCAAEQRSQELAKLRAKFVWSLIN
jgi:hypothetical protein